MDISFEEPNWELAKNYLLENGETVKGTAQRNEKLYAEVHEFLVKLKHKPYDEKIWSVNMLEAQIEGLGQNLKSIENPNKELILLIRKWKKWLIILEK